MPKRNLAWILVIGVIALLMWQLPQIIAERDVVYKAFGPLADARAQIHKRFAQDVKDDALTKAAVDAGIRAMVQALQDNHAIYLNADEYERFKRRTDGVFGGIGADVWSTGLGLEVLSRVPDSPAVRADILPGDVITHIDGKPVAKVPLVEAVNNMLNGPPDSEVKLTMVRPTDSVAKPPRQVAVRRAVIHLDSIKGWTRTVEGGWRYMLDPKLGIGYVRLTKFTPDVDERLDAVVEGLLREGLRGLILDLRDNTGGLLDSAREVADRFMESGVIVRTRGRRTDEKSWEAMHEGTYPEFPLVVLVNGSTASAAEIVAGALGDHRRAEVIGERTYGKGSVQEVVELDRDSGAIKLTTSFYYLPNGQCIDRMNAKWLTGQSAALEVGGEQASLGDGDNELIPKEAGVWGVKPSMEVVLDDHQRKACQQAWRESTREVVADATTRPVTSAPSQPDARALRLMVQNLIKADPQFARAIEVLRRQISPSTEPSTTQPETTTSEPAPNSILEVDGAISSP